MIGMLMPSGVGIPKAWWREAFVCYPFGGFSLPAFMNTLIGVLIGLFGRVVWRLPLAMTVDLAVFGGGLGRLSEAG